MNSEQNPLISFCMSTYNRPDFLKNQLKCILQQTYQNFEIIISDNDIDKSGASVANSFGDTRIKYFCNSENIGMINSFNKSIERAGGEFVVMITDDDPVYPNMLSELVNLSVVHKGFNLYFGKHDIEYKNKENKQTFLKETGLENQKKDFASDLVSIYQPKDFADAFLKHELLGGVLWSVAMVPRSFLLNNGLIANYGHPCFADCVYILLSGLSKGAIYLNKPLGSLVMHDDNYSFNRINYNLLKMAPIGAIEAVLQNVNTNFFDKDFEKDIKKYFANSFVQYIVKIHNKNKFNRIENGEFKNFVKEIFKIDFIKKYKTKYYLVTKFPKLFKLYISLKKYI
jgi:glycosyltransferase involved in cell wall biosynthesis